MRQTVKTRQVMIRETAWMGIYQIAIILVGLLANSILARLLGALKLGEFQLIIAWLGAASVFSLPGTDVTIVKASLKNYDNYFYLAMRRSLLFSAAGALFVTAVGLVFYMQESYRHYGFIALMVALGIPISTGLKYDSVLVGKCDFKLSRQLNLFGALANLILVAGVAWIYPKSYACFIVFLLARLIVAAAGLRVVFQRIRQSPPDTVFESELEQQGWRQTLLGAFSQLVGQLDRIILGTINPVLLGYYHIATLIPMRIKDNAKVMLSVVTARWGGRSTKDNSNSLQKYFWPMIGFGVIVASVLWIVLPWLIPFLFGTAYMESVRLGQWFSLTIIFKFWGACYGGFNQFQQDGVFVQKLEVLRQVVYLTLLLFLIREYGAMGIIVAFIASDVLSALFMLQHFGKYRRSIA